MKKEFIIFSIVLSLLVLAPLVSAEASYIFKQGEDINFSIQVFNSDNSKATAATSCYFSLKNPSAGVLVDDSLMNFHAGGYYGYWLDSYQTVNVSGDYPTTIRCDDGADYGYSSFAIMISPTGSKQYSIFQNPLLLVFVSLGMILILMGVLFKLPTLGFLGGVLILLSGVYTMIYGLNNITDMYTRSIGLVLIGLGFIISLMAAFEWTVNN